MNPFIRHIPAALVRRAAQSYVAGDSLAAAMDTAARLWTTDRLLSTLDLLAEETQRTEEARVNVATYLDMVEAVAADGRFSTQNCRPTISLKPSAFTTQPLDRGGLALDAADAIFRIAEKAAARRVMVTLDMEGRQWTDFTLRLLRDLHAAGHTHVGGVLQSRLHRTQDDLQHLPPRARVRLVIGIYQEPKAVALEDKAAMKERLLSLAEQLLRRGHFVELATHDEPYVRRFVDEIVPRSGAHPEQFELQMLYGVPRRDLQAEMIDRGISVRLYVPFARNWDQAVAYLRRRLDEYPGVMLLVMRNLGRT